MPLMMDDDLEMDDLFGDGGGLTLPSQPPSKDLHQRVDEMRGSGSCQYVVILLKSYELCLLSVDT